MVKPVGISLDGLDKITLFLRLPGDIFSQQGVRKAENGGQGCAQLMRDHRQETGLYLVGSLGLVAGFFFDLQDTQVEKGNRGLVHEHFEMTQLEGLEMMFLSIKNQQAPQPVPQCNQRECCQSVDLSFQQEITHSGR